MLSRIEELKLIARCVTLDDHRAFARLVDAYSPALRRYIFNMTLGDASLTDDIAQNTFIKAYTSLKSFRCAARFSTWLYTIASRELADHRRRRSEMPSEDLSTAPDSVSDPHRSTELRHDLMEAMKTLNDNERAAILLYYLEDRPLKDVARITGRPEGSVKASIHRAKQKMSHFLIK
ncbi:MAG: sigma-70 family RNA polymerase sigma factor [Barnesiella sp.]|nr:sigma-70 family RNA polymerase sigma factor [Barnesiella sp.]